MKFNVETLRNPAKKAEWIFRQPMNPCPKCGSYNMTYQVPIQKEIPDEFDEAKKFLEVCVREINGEETPLI